MTFEQIKELIELVGRHGLRGMEVERSGFRLRIDGQSTSVPEVTATATEAVKPAVPARPSAPAAEPEEPAEPEGPPEDAHVIESPIVGTFYRRPSPDADPYVDVGERVKKGQVLCIVEAMKLMNEIESDVDGEVLEVYPQNAQPVEYGEPLFAIRAE